MKCLIVGFACGALLWGARPAAADPVVITSGAISAELGEGVSLNIDSSPFSLALIGSADTVRMPEANGFHNGQTLDLSATLDGLFRENPGTQTTMLHLNLTARPVQVPTIDGTGIISVQLRTPFTLTGTIGGNDVSGAGTLSAAAGSASGLTPELLDVTSADWVFSSSPLPTPEPAPLILLGTGVIALIAISRWTTNRSRSSVL